jgi:hypothetical protein
MRLAASIAVFLLIASPAIAQTEADQKVLDKADEIEERVAAIRGLAFKRPVEKSIYSKDQLEEFLLANLDEELPDEKAEGWEMSLKIFGLIPQDMNVKETLVSFLVSQVGGFYDPDKKCLNCLSTKIEFLAHIVMAHEILHSLQDQYVDLEGYYADVEFNDDILGARQSVIEGEAQHLTTLYSRAHAFEMAADMAEVKPGDMGMFALEQFAALQGAPPYFTEVMTFPYLGGEKFIKAGLEEGGWAIVNALYKAPPHSTEQIIHPEKFFGERDEPVKIVLPDLGPVLGEGYENIYENTMGELQTSILIKLTADPIRAMRASAGWDGDTYAVFRDKESGRALMVWALTFDSAKDAAEFFEAESKGLRKKYEARAGGEDAAGGHAIVGPAEGDDKASACFIDAEGNTALLEMRGKDVVVLDNFPGKGDLLTAVREKAWTFTREEFDFKSFRPGAVVKDVDGEKDG